MFKINDYPNELLLRIFSYLKSKETVRISQVSKRWHFLSQDRQIWVNLLKEEFDYQCQPDEDPKTLCKRVYEVKQLLRNKHIAAIVNAGEGDEEEYLEIELRKRPNDKNLKDNLKSSRKIVSAIISVYFKTISVNSKFQEQNKLSLEKTLLKIFRRVGNNLFVAKFLIENVKNLNVCLLNYAFGHHQNEFTSLDIKKASWSTINGLINHYLYYCTELRSLTMPINDKYTITCAFEFLIPMLPSLEKIGFYIDEPNFMKVISDLKDLFRCYDLICEKKNISFKLYASWGIICDFSQGIESVEMGILHSLLNNEISDRRLAKK